MAEGGLFVLRRLATDGSLEVLLAGNDVRVGFLVDLLGIAAFLLDVGVKPDPSVSVCVYLMAYSLHSGRLVVGHNESLLEVGRRSTR